MPDTVDMTAAFDTLRDACADEFEDIADSMINDIREMLSVDVERENGVVSVRSVRGEPPRRETGALWESIAQAVEVGLYGVDAAVYTDKVYSAALESTAFRTGQRPHWITLYENWLSAVPERIAAKIETL